MRALSYGKKRAGTWKRILKTINLLGLLIFLWGGAAYLSRRAIGIPVTISDSIQPIESFLYFLSYNSLSWGALLPGQFSIGQSMQFSK